MKFQTERCLQCGGLDRPTNLESQYGLDRRGTVPVTDYWFCSDKCYEDAIDPHIEDSNYSLKYNRKNLSPKLRREILALSQECEDTYINTPGEPGTDRDMDFLRRLKNHFEEQKEERIYQWKLKQFSLLTAAQVGFHSRIRQESMCEDNKKAEEYLKKLDKEAKDEEKQWARDEEETKRIHERQRKERERQEKIAEQQRKEQEKMEEQKRLEEERIEALREKPIPFDYRFDHTHIIGSSGQGKSSLIISQFLKDIHDPRNPSIVILDPKGTMVEQLRRIEDDAFTRMEPDKLCWGWNDRLIVIDPTICIPALNMFAPPKRQYPPAIAQQLENNTISLFQYVFSSKGSALTDKQLTCFSYAVRLVLTIPGATIHTFLDLMNDKPIPKIGGMRPDSPFKPFIDKLGPVPKRFFYDSFYDITEYGGTKDQIATRIYGMLHFAIFDAMFSTPENKIDMFKYLQEGMIVLISSPKAILGPEGSQLFSRYMVALTLQAAFERITIPKQQWHPAFLVIDEAQDVVDEIKTQELLQQAREFKLGVTLAHQQIKGQLTEALFSTISANTRIKYAATRSSQDASSMARDMNCEPSLIMQRNIGEFACFVGAMTKSPFIAIASIGQINTVPKLSDDYSQVLCDMMRDICPASSTPPATQAAEQPKQESVQILAVEKIAEKKDPSAPAPWGKA